LMDLEEDTGYQPLPTIGECWSTGYFVETPQLHGLIRIFVVPGLDMFYRINTPATFLGLS